MTPEDAVGRTFRVIGDGWTFTIDSALEGGETLRTSTGLEVPFDTLRDRWDRGEIVDVDVLLEERRGDHA